MLSGHIQQNWHYLKIAIISWFWKKNQFFKKIYFLRKLNLYAKLHPFLWMFWEKKKTRVSHGYFCNDWRINYRGEWSFFSYQSLIFCCWLHVLCGTVAYLISSVHYIWPYSVQSRAVSNKHHVIPIQVLVVIDTAKYLAFQFLKIVFSSLNLVCFCISLFLPLLPLCNNSRLMTSWTLMRGRKFLGAIQFLSRS